MYQDSYKLLETDVVIRSELRDLLTTRKVIQVNLPGNLPKIGKGIWPDGP